MLLSAIKTINFRNLIDAETNLLGKDVFLVGKNGQGKSNFLESIYFCSYASSFRGSKDTELISKQKKNCSVILNTKNYIENIINIKIESGKKSISIDNKKIIDRKTLLSLISCIVFCPEDIEFITGTLEKRRWFFDQNICIHDDIYLECLQKYRKILKTRNLVLKEIKDGKTKKLEILEILDPQMIEYGIVLCKKRETEILNFSSVFEYYYKKVADISGINILYQSTWNTYEPLELLKFVQEKKEKEIFLGTTLTGPHRDKYTFIKDGKDFSDNASTGQKRLLSLLLRIAQTIRFNEITKRKPILLFDDVLLELDGEKRKIFLDILPEYEQAFYTFLPEEPFDNYKKSDTIIYYVNEGKLYNDKYW